MKKDSFVLYTDYLQHIRLLSSEEKGVLFEAILLYAAGEEIPFLSPAAEMAFSFIRSKMDADAERYEKTCKARKEAGKLGGRPKASDYSENQDKAKKANGFLDNQSKAKKPDNEHDHDNDLKENTLKGVKEKRFAPPTKADVEKYCQEKGYSVDAERFVDFYESKGWMVGKNRMKDWKAAVRNWNRSQRQELTAEAGKRQEKAAAPNRFHNFHERDYDFSELQKALVNR